MRNTLRIATRKSQLALWQANTVAKHLSAANPGIEVVVLPMSTSGDRQLETLLAKQGGKGLFIKELEIALLEQRADIAVHSMKDVPVDILSEMHIAAVLERDDPRDAFVSNRFEHFLELPKNSTLGTSSLRRRCQLQHARPDLSVGLLRGNVHTRLRKLDDGEFDAIVLAVAGLNRLNLADRIREPLDPEVSLPAVCQGTIGIECRLDDEATNELVGKINHADTWTVTAGERAVSRKLCGGCNTPVAVYGELSGDRLELRALVGSQDGSEILRDNIAGRASDAEALGTRLGEQLLDSGAARLIEASGDSD